MKIKIETSLKYIGVFILILFSSIACEKDFEDVGVGLVDNNLFSTESANFKIVAYNENVTKSRVDITKGISYLIGVHKDANFGKINAAFISQLGLPTSKSFGDNVSIDTIILDIPYYATKKEDNSNGTPNFKLDSIFGDKDLEYTLSVHELGTFLSALDPQDPTKRKKYYSNETYLKKALLYSGLFKPNKNDTVLYVKRSFFDAKESIDTIKKDKLVPSIKIPLDTTFFRTNFIDKDDDIAFNTQSNFIEYFRGIYIDTQSNNGSIMTLKMSDATVTIYYTNIILTDEKDKDLNGDGDTDDKDVPVRTKLSKAYSMNGIRVNKYVRDYAGVTIQNYLPATSTAKEKGVDKLFIQGASGSMAILELFKDFDDQDFEDLKNKNWLINEANITLYLDGDQSVVPEKLLLYNYDNESQILDVFSENQFNGIGGSIERNKDDNNKPVKYKFRITDYITRILKSDNPKSKLNRLGLKVLNTSDIPDFKARVLDTVVTDYSWIPKGVVLKGNNFAIKDNDSLKLEIFYSKQ